LICSSRLAIGAAAAAALTAGPPVRLSGQSPAPTIDTIIVVNRNVFDLQEPDAPGFIARLANRLHARTRAGVIRSTLLINPGDRYDSARVAESERALRNLYVFSRVRIDTTRLDGRLALRVATTDGWSTKPQLGYSSAGGDVTWMVGLVEDNLLGNRDVVHRRVQQDARPPDLRSRAREPPLLVTPRLAAGSVQQQVGWQAGHLAGGSAVL